MQQPKNSTGRKPYAINTIIPTGDAYVKVKRWSDNNMGINLAKRTLETT